MEQGTIVSLVGPNGAGKTTLLNMVSGIEKPTSGSVMFEGENITHLQVWARTAKGIGRTFQLSGLFRGVSVLENVLVGRHIHIKSGVYEALFKLPRFRTEEVAATEQSLKFLRFMGCEALANKYPEELPYGQQRVVELALSPATGSRLLLLDEPCAGLNPSEVQHFEEALRQIRGQGITLLLVEHNVPLVMRVSDKVVVLRFGQKIAEGKPGDVARDAEVIKSYLGGEIKGA